MIFEKSETLQSLINAFAGESQSRNKYTMYAKIAAKEGFKIIEEVFMETAENEREHAKLFYKEIPNGFYSPNAKYPFFAGTTYENLISSAAAERDEWENIYKSSAQIAKSEGYEDISNGSEDSGKAMHITIDKNKAMSMGLSVVQIYQDINKKLTHSKSAVNITVDGKAYDGCVIPVIGDGAAHEVVITLG